ncbi:hypothetical protein [Streptomyces sp. NPDC059460]|uniref:hypothetical protein n=1 Tax=Streptomyces sp. NPDC059460 TaxID=3346840 RepID=UPI0036C7F19F
MLPHPFRTDGCSRYSPGHHLHWIHAKKCSQEPGQAVELLLTSDDVRDDGWVGLRPAFDYAEDLPDVWMHAPHALQELLAEHRGRVFWLPQWHALRIEHQGDAAVGLVNVGLESGALCATDAPGSRPPRGGVTYGL